MAGIDVRISELPAATEGHADDRFETTQIDGTTLVSRSITLDQVSDAVAAILPASDWADITGKPSTFPPTVPIAWTDVSGKPTTFAPDPEAVDDRVAALIVAGSNITTTYNDVANTLTIASTAAGGGGGTVTSTSVVSANGLAGTVATPTTTPAITLSTTITGMLKGNGTAISAATGGTDYMRPSDVSGAYLPLAGGTLTGTLGWNTGAPLTVSTPALNVQQTWNNGATNFSGIVLNITNTASAYPSYPLSLNIAGTGTTWFWVDQFGGLFANGGLFTNSNISLSNTALAAGGTQDTGISWSTTAHFGVYFGAGAPNKAQARGSLYLDNASPGVPWYNNNGSTGWDRLVGETSTQTLTSKTLSPSLSVYNSTLSTGFGYLADIRQQNTASTYTALLIEQNATNVMNFEVANQANVKGTLNLQPFGGTVNIPILTGTTATFNAGASSPAVRVNGNDGVLLGLFAGATKGVRIVAGVGGTSIEGVDSTGVGSFQTLQLNGTNVLAPTPLAASNTNEVATTAWVRGNGGTLLQTVNFQTGAVATGTTVIPNDDTIPQITEGTEFMTLAITPKSATSKLIIEVVWVGASSVVNNHIVALFQDSTANALAAVEQINASATNLATVSLRHTMTSGTTSATTFRVRAGGNWAGTTTFNGSGTRLLGGVMASSIVIQEVL